MEGNKDASVDVRDVEDRAKGENHEYRSMDTSLGRHFASNCDGLRTEFKEVRAKVVNSISYIPDLVAQEVSKATSRRKTDIKYVAEFLVGSTSLMTNMFMTLRENEEVLKTFALFSKRQV